MYWRILWRIVNDFKVGYVYIIDIVCYFNKKLSMFFENKY